MRKHQNSALEKLKQIGRCINSKRDEQMKKIIKRFKTEKIEKFIKRVKTKG